VMSTHDDPRDPSDSGHSANRTLAESDPPTALVPRDSVRELPPGSVVNETYEVDAKLGAGAMGEVYAARHIKLGKRVAIKVIGRRLSEDAEAIERFAMEARTLAQIQHPAIVAVEHVGELSDGRAYFVMEFLRGETLFDRISRGRVPIAEALRILDQMARGLDAAHGSGVTHRDLKPENVFLVHMPGEPSIVKLVDFGLAKLAADVANVDHRAERTQSGVALGTPMYMSPEQARGPDVDYRTDIYALGCVAYELLLGQPLFPHAQTAPELYAAHLHEVPPPPRSIWSAVPPQLDLVLFAMVAKDPAHRPTLEQVRAVVATITAALPGDRAPTMIVGESQGSSRRKWTTAIAAITLVGGIAIGAAMTRGGSKDIPVHTQVAAPAAVPADAVVALPATHAPVAHAPVAPALAPATTGIPTDTRREPARNHPAVKRTGSASVPTAAVPLPTTPIDAGVEPSDPPHHQPSQQPQQQPPPPIVDRNQTINPFKHKVNP
jgi:tRNA A-37 threonylcarbamoyl transferase component Bud32